MTRNSDPASHRGLGASFIAASLFGAIVAGPRVINEIDTPPKATSSRVPVAPKISAKTLHEITGQPVGKPTIEAVAASVVRLAVTQQGHENEYVACSGFVLNNFLVTARHCLSEAKIEKVDVYTPGQDKPVDTLKEWVLAGGDDDVALGTFTQPWPETSISAPELPTALPTFGQQLTETGIPGGQLYHNGQAIPLGHERTFTGSLIYVGQPSHPSDFILSPANSRRTNAELDIGGASGSPVIGDFDHGFSVAVLDTRDGDKGNIANLEQRNNLASNSPIHDIAGATVLTASLYASMANQLGK